MKMEKSERVLACSADYKWAKFAAIVIATWLGLTNVAAAYADTGAQWTNSCISGLECIGGRGSNAPAAYPRYLRY